jgi:ATP/maltotriose-dependent transcriptional regulator MalT
LTWWGGLLLLLYAEGSYAKMVTLGRSLARAGRAADDSKMQAIGARVEGGGLIGLGRVAEGTALLAAALPADPAAGDLGAFEAASLLSAVYLAMGEVDRCAALSERMLAAAERADDQVLTAVHTVFLAGVCYVRGDWDRGRDLVGRARELFAASSSPMAVRVAGVLGPVMIWHGAWQEARTYLEGTLQAARSLRRVHDERVALTHLISLDLLDGRPQDAVARLYPVTADRPVPAAEDLTWDYPVEFLSVVAQAHLELGELDRARAYAGLAVGHARRMGTWIQGIRALEVHGTVLARDGHHDLARAAYQEGLDRVRAIRFPYGQARLLHAYGLFDRQRKHHGAAHEKFTQALAILERLGADNDADRLRRAIADTPPSEDLRGQIR